MDLFTLCIFLHESITNPLAFNRARGLVPLMIMGHPFFLSSSSSSSSFQFLHFFLKLCEFLELLYYDSSRLISTVNLVNTHKLLKVFTYIYIPCFVNHAHFWIKSRELVSTVEHGHPFFLLFLGGFFLVFC